MRVRGKQIFSLPQRKHYFALNKPKGYLCSNSPGSADEGGAANLVTDLFADWLRQVTATIVSETYMMLLHELSCRPRSTPIMILRQCWSI